MGELKNIAMTAVWSALILGTVIAAIAITPLLIGAGVLFLVYAVIKIMNTEVVDPRED